MVKRGSLATYPPDPLCKDFIYLFQGRGSIGREGRSPSLKSLPPLLPKERGIKRVRLNKQSL